jgi:rhodanese-related sulfurtransferase
MDLMTPAQASAAVTGGEAVIIDVREADETAQARIPGATIIPMSELLGRLAEVPRDRTVVFLCHSGARSDNVCRYLEENEGFTGLVNLEGGIVAWSQAGLPIDQ